MLDSYRLFSHLLIFLAITLTTTACAPVYRAVYDYSPPQDTSGRQCLNHCLHMRAMCRVAAEQQANQERMMCQQQLAFNYAMCIAAAKVDSAHVSCSVNTYCERQPDTSQCQAEYNLCYQNCGGTIHSRQVCVAFCQ